MSTLKLSKTEDIEIFIDPFRTKIMRVMKGAERPMTVKEIADTMGEVPAKVYYHVKKLESIGVIYIKYTKEINGIIAKYYDFTTDMVALCVSQTEDAKAAVASRMTKLYGSYFDEAKQVFYDRTLAHQDARQDESAFQNYFTVKDRFCIAPGKADEFNQEFKLLLDRYHYDGVDAMTFYVFCAMIQTDNEKRK